MHPGEHRETRRTPGRAVDAALGALVLRTAARWPADVADELADAWTAELAVLTRGSGRHRGRAIAFVCGLVVALPVEAAGEARATWWNRAGDGLRAAVRTGAYVLLAAGLFNLCHGTGLPLLPAAVAVMAWIGATTHARIRRSGLTLAAAAMFGFLMAGNAVRLMPYMGWRDVGPAVVAWLAGSAATITVAVRVARAGRAVRARAVALGGAALTMLGAAVAGGAHSAAALHVPLRSAPLWLPRALALGHGGTPDPAHLLAGNLSAMVGPLLLYSALLTGYACARRDQAVRTARRRLAASEWLGWTLASVAVWWSADAAYRHLHDTTMSVLPSIANNAYAFGFGFATTRAGQIGLVALAVLAGVGLMRDRSRVA